MQNYLEKSQGTEVCMTVMGLMELSDNMKYLASKHLEPKLNKPLDDVKLCAILQCMIPQYWESTNWKSVSEVIATN